MQVIEWWKRSGSCVSAASRLLAMLSIVSFPALHRIDAKVVVAAVDPLYASLIDSDLPLDLTAKPCELSATQLAEILAEKSHSSAASNSITSGKYVLIDRELSEFAQNAAHRLAPLGYAVCHFTAASAASLTDTTIPAITVIPGDLAQSPISYYGKRCARTLARFVETLEIRLAQPVPFATIATKLDKKAFERVSIAKVIAYFPDSTAPAFAQFQQAARRLTPNPPFYVVHDPKLANKMRLTQPGQIAIVHRVERSIIYFEPPAPATPASPAATPESQSNEPELQSLPKTLPETSQALSITAADIIAWIDRNRGLLLHEIDDTNVYDAEINDQSKYLFVAVADQAAPFGAYFKKMLMKTIHNISRENEIRANLSAAQQQQQRQQPLDETVQEQAPPAAPPTPIELIRLDDIEIVWIDLQKYPRAIRKLSADPQFAAAAIPASANTEVFFGLIRIPISNSNSDPQQQSSDHQQQQWFDMSQLIPAAATPTNNQPQQPQQQLAALKGCVEESASIQTIRDWILTVTNRLPLAPPTISTPVTDKVEGAESMKIEILPQQFSLEPEPKISVHEGRSFVLDCRVRYRAGKCGWTKNGVLVIAEDNEITATSSSPYQWVTAKSKMAAENLDRDDCSISVTGADAARDSGEWRCSISALAMPEDSSTIVVPAIESSASLVEVRSNSENQNKKNGIRNQKTKSEL